MFSETNFSADLLMRSEIAVGRCWEPPLDSEASRVTVSDIVPPRSSDGFLNAERILVKVSEGATASEKIAVAFLLCSTRSDISETRFSEMPLATLKSLLAASEIGGASDRDFTRPLFTTSEIVDARSSDVVLNPVNRLDAASEMVGVSAKARNPLKTLATASEIAGLSDDALNPLKPLAERSEGATASERKEVVNLSLLTRSDISEARFSETPLAPLKTLATESATVGLSVSVLNPVKSLATASEIAGLSDDALNPLKTLPARSEGATDSERKLKVPLLTVSDIREARFSETPLAPLKTLATESATVGISVSVLNPAKTLPMTSEGTTLSSANFPAPLLTESAIETTSDSDLGTPLFTTSEIATASERIAVVFLLCSTRSDISEARFSEIPLAPPKSLLAASEIGGASDKDFTRPLFTTSAIVDARFSDVVLNPVKSLDAASEMMEDSASERAPVKSLAMPSDTVGPSPSPR